jgi:pyrroline-5-carboxylate reductase
MNDLVGGKLLLVGCGKMGSALLQGWLAEGLLAADVLVVEPAADPARTARAPGVGMLASAEAVSADFRPAAVVFAVKPQSMAEVVPHYVRFQLSGALFLSIAAGTTIAFFEQHLGADAAVVRVMPNTPAAIRRGMSVLCANGNVSEAQRELAGRLMAAAGATAWIDDEGLMDAVTAVSGSGPAYVFLLIETLAAAGAAAGLPAALAAQLALETVAGAGALAQSADEDPAQLRVNVTSPGGTTAAALEVLMAEDGLAQLMQRAVAAATRRGRELGG